MMPFDLEASHLIPGLGLGGYCSCPEAVLRNQRLTMGQFCPFSISFILLCLRAPQKKRGGLQKVASFFLTHMGECRGGGGEKWKGEFGNWGENKG